MSKLLSRILAWFRDLPKISASTLCRLGFLPSLLRENGTYQVFFPEWAYDLFNLVMFAPNYFLTLLPTRVPSRFNVSDWTLDPNLAPGKLPDPHPPVAELCETLRRLDNTPLDDAALFAVFDSLPAPTTNDMLGNWSGHFLLTGSWLDMFNRLLETPLKYIGVQWGKRFITPYKGDPLVYYLGNKVAVPAPIWGSVSAPELRHRGKIGAAMVYDSHPWRDHFRILDNGSITGQIILLGNFMVREKHGGWFTLVKKVNFEMPTQKSPD